MGSSGRVCRTVMCRVGRCGVVKGEAIQPVNISPSMAVPCATLPGNLPRVTARVLWLQSCYCMDDRTISTGCPPAALLFHWGGRSLCEDARATAWGMPGDDSNLAVARVAHGSVTHACTYNPRLEQAHPGEEHDMLQATCWRRRSTSSVLRQRCGCGRLKSSAEASV